MRQARNLLLSCGLLAALAACSEPPVPGGPPQTAEAGVPVGSALKWRQLCEVPRSPAGVQPGGEGWKPQPEMVVGNFDRSKGNDILFIDFTGETRIYQPDGRSSAVKKAHWEGIARYYPWDIDQNGIDDLVPAGNAWVFAPIFGKITIKGAAGG